MYQPQIRPCAASDHVTRILKEYGDVLDRYQLAPDKADIGRELRVLRGLLLLIQLTGLVHILNLPPQATKATPLALYPEGQTGR